MTQFNTSGKLYICESCKLSNGRAMMDSFFMFLLLFYLHHPPGDALLLNYTCLLLILLKDEYCLNHKLLLTINSLAKLMFITIY